MKIWEVLASFEFFVGGVSACFVAGLGIIWIALCLAIAASMIKAVV